MKSFTVLLLTSSVAIATASEPAPTLPKVVLLGDSIRMNYQAAVTQALEGKAIVSAPKDNCSHTAFVLENLERWLSGLEDAQVIHINVGLHDMFLNPKTGKPRHTLETYETNLRAIFEKLRKLTDAELIFAMTSVVNEEQQATSKGYGRVVRRNSDIQTYNAAALIVLEEFGVVVNDLNRFMKKTGPAKILRPSDGIHLSPEGCRIMGNEVARVILKNLNTGE